MRNFRWNIFDGNLSFQLKNCSHKASKANSYLVVEFFFRKASNSSTNNNSNANCTIENSPYVHQVPIRIVPEICRNYQKTLPHLVPYSINIPIVKHERFSFLFFFLLKF